MKHHASNCRWAAPTLSLPAPFWWEAEVRPWACVREDTHRPLETTEVCETCPFWEPRSQAQHRTSAPFVAHHERYEQWFEEHPAAYGSELLALRPFVPLQGRGLDIGVGTGRFAAPLGVSVGIDPALPMLAYAARRGVSVVGGAAEALPFVDGSFDYALIVTTLCFLDSPHAMLDEARRVLRPGGTLVIGFIDRNSAIGRHYEAHRLASVFYRDATFYGASEVEDMLCRARFTVREWAQTLFGASPAIHDVQPLRPGTGHGAFVVVSAVRQG